MSLLQRLLGKADLAQEQVRPLWHKVVEIAREPRWYANGGIADTVPGRFDCITLVLALVMLRMEGDPALSAPSGRLTELFVHDMDGQLRQSGIGDLSVGKQIGKLMGALGGRIEALRPALAAQDNASLIAAVERNVTLRDKPDLATIAQDLRGLANTLGKLDNAALLAGRIAR